MSNLIEVALSLFPAPLNKKLFTLFINGIYTCTMISVSIMLVIAALFAPWIFSTYIGVYDTKNLFTLVYMVTFIFLVYFAIPVLLAKFIFKEKLQNLGLVFPK